MIYCFEYIIVLQIFVLCNPKKSGLESASPVRKLAVEHEVTSSTKKPSQNANGFLKISFMNQFYKSNFIDPLDLINKLWQLPSP